MTERRSCLEKEDRKRERRGERNQIKSIPADNVDVWDQQEEMND